MEGSAGAHQLLRCGLRCLELTEEALTSEGAADESGVGGQHQAAGMAGRGGVTGQGGGAPCGDAMLLAGGASAEPLV